MRHAQPDVRARLAKRLRALRQVRGLSQGDLGRKAGICQDTISVIELGLKSTTVDVLACIARALGTTMSDLLGERHRQR